MKKYILAMAIVAATGILIESGCGGPGGHSTVVEPPGLLAVFGGDAPQCSSVISFVVTISGLTLTPENGGSAVSVLSGGQPVTVDFASLMDSATVFSLSNVTPGIYNALGITLSNPVLTYLDTSTSPPSLKMISPQMSLQPINLNFNPAITVASNGIVGLQLDFDLLNSISISNNQFTVTPTFTANLASASGSNGFAEFDDLSGLVQSVSTSSTNPSFVGSFTISSPNAPTFTVYVTSSTTFAGAVSGLSGLTTGTFVEMDAFLNSGGNIVANTVVAEDEEDQASGEAAFAGLITSVTPKTGNATQFTLLVGEENPDMSSRVALFSTLTFNIAASSTTFGLTAQAADFANFSFGSANLAAGQRVVVHGTLPSGSGTAQTATARSVFLGLQSVLGNLSTNPSTPVTIASDGVDGGFTLVPCSALFQPAQITALAAQQTTYVGLSNLSSLNSTGPHFLLVRGLLFDEQSTTSFGVESWTVPANVQVASHIHQLP